MTIVQTVNGYLYSGMGMINEAHECIIQHFTAVADFKAPSQGDAMDAPDGRLMGR